MTGWLLVMVAITEAHSMFFAQFLVSREKPSDKGIKINAGAKRCKRQLIRL